ncbi:MAG: hypothetical protein ABIF77_10045 [bacterium]
MSSYYQPEQLKRYAEIGEGAWAFLVQYVQFYLLLGLGLKFRWGMFGVADSGGR